MSGETAAPPDDATLGLLSDLAAGLARQAGQVVEEMRASAIGSATTKSSPTDPVTEADKAAEAVVVDGLRRARPDDGIIGEEGTDRTGTSDLVWYIDPIDGTVNYLYGIPAYSVSVALGHRDGPIWLGAVYNPVTDELFRAEAGRGATLDGRPIRANETDDLAATLVATGFSYRAERRRAQGAVMVELLETVRDIRRFGSAALDLCSVACGRVDAYFEAGLNPWDYAAGWLIATEAGARCDDLRGGPPGPGFLVASAPGVHDALGDRLRTLDADRLD